MWSVFRQGNVIFQRSWISLVENQSLVPEQRKGQCEVICSQTRTQVKVGAVERKTVTPLTNPTGRHWQHSSARETAYLSCRHQHQRVGAVTALGTEKERNALNEGPKRQTPGPKSGHWSHITSRLGQEQGQALVFGRPEHHPVHTTASLLPSRCMWEVSNRCFSLPSSMKISKNIPSGKD